MQKLFESLDEKVFTPELKQSLQEKFETAVQDKAQAMSQVIADEMLESKIDELDEKAQSYGEYLLNEAETRVEAYKAETTEKISGYIDLVVQEFVTEARSALNESLKAEQSDMLIEAFDSMLVAGGVEFTQIMEAKELHEGTNGTAEDRVNQLAEEVLKLKDENAELLRMGLVSEMSEGLTLVQSQRFERLAKLVEFDNSAKYVERLETLLESVKGFNPESELTESVRKTHETRTHTQSSALYSHLI